MASILTLIFHGWLLLEEKHVAVGYISEAYSMLSCLFFPFFFKCPWGTAKQLAMEKQLSSPEIILIWCVTEHLIFLTVFQWMHFHMNVSIQHTYLIYFRACMFSVSLCIISLFPKQNPSDFSAAELLIYFQNCYKAMKAIQTTLSVNLRNCILTLNV